MAPSSKERTSRRCSTQFMRILSKLLLYCIPAQFSSWQQLDSNAPALQRLTEHNLPAEFACMQWLITGCVSSSRRQPFLHNAQVMHGTGRHRHMRTRPGFICCRAYDTDRQRVMPLPVPIARVNHKLVEEVKSDLQSPRMM